MILNVFYLYYDILKLNCLFFNFVLFFSQSDPIGKVYTTKINI